MFFNYSASYMIYYHTCTPPQDIYAGLHQTFSGLARAVGYVDIKNNKNPVQAVRGFCYLAIYFSAVLETKS